MPGTQIDAETLRRLTADFPPHRLEPYSTVGIEGTITRMRAASMGLRGEHNPRLIKHVRDVCRGVRAKDYVSELAALLAWTCRHYRYARDPVHVEYIEDPVAFWDRGLSSDCDDVAAFLAACAQILGNPCRFVTVGFKHSPEPFFSHVYTEAFVSRLGNWVMLDPVAGPMAKAMRGATVWRANYPLDSDMGKVEIFRRAA